MTERLESQTVIDGRYRVLHRIGSGGMADVYCAEDLQLGRQVALKVLYRRFAEDQEFVERFRREASSAAGLQHQHVVSVYDRGEWDGTYYIAMEFLRGRSLKTIVQEEAPLDPGRAIDLTTQVLRAARFAHRRGVIHRDLKPHNVIVDADDRAKVTDFGIARAGASDMTQTGSIMGTAQYLSPEQAEGLAVSSRSDLYSIGIVLYELLTGRVPFEGESAVTIALKQVSEPPVPPSAYNAAVTPQLEAVVLRALEKDPARRFPDADAFIAALQAARGGAAADPPTAVVTAPVPLAAVDPPTPVEPLVPTYADVYPAEPLVVEERERGGPGWWWLLALLVVVAAIVAGVLLLGGGKKVTVPAVVGSEQAAAQARLQRAGFSTDVRLRASSQPEGVVFAQDPAGNARAAKGSTVTLSVSSGPSQVTVPPVEGLTAASAVGRLQRAGLKADQQTKPSADVPRDRVISSSPREGSRAARGSTVLLTVSSGPEKVTVPGVEGQSFEDARTTLENAGFVVRRRDQETDTEAPDTVLRQSPAADASADKGSTVTLTVAKAPADVQVPDITGETVGVAKARLTRAGFSVTQVDQDVDSPEGDGVVIDESPSSGKAKKGSTVTITVGRYNPALGGQTTTPTTPGTTTG
jgi:serine/threonine-protein kinase